MNDKQKGNVKDRKPTFWEPLNELLFGKRRKENTLQRLQAKVDALTQTTEALRLRDKDSDLQIQSLVKILLEIGTRRGSVIPLAPKNSRFAIITVFKEPPIPHLQIPFWYNFQLSLPLEYPNGPVGHAYLNVTRDNTAQLREIFVVPELRNQHFGSELLYHVIAKAKTMGDEWAPMRFELPEKIDPALTVHFFGKNFKKVALTGNELLVERR